MYRPLDLTPAQQDWLAEISRKAASIRYDYDILNKEPDFEKLGTWFAMHIIERGFPSQRLGELYDKLHRGGSNV